MRTMTTATLLTADDLLAMPDGDLYELVDGRLKEMGMSNKSDWVAGRLHRRLDEFCDAHGLGWVYPETGYQCFPGRPRLVRKPDVSFVRLERSPEGPPDTGYMRIAPDLAVESVSPQDSAEEVADKVLEYLDAGVRLVWTVYPRGRYVLAYRPDGTAWTIRGDGELDGGDVMPGFRCKVSALFPPAAPPGETS